MLYSIGGSGREDQQSVQKLLELSDYMTMNSSQEGYLRSFVVRYLGSLEVDKNKGYKLKLSYCVR